MLYRVLTLVSSGTLNMIILCVILYLLYNIIWVYVRWYNCPKYVYSHIAYQNTLCAVWRDLWMAASRLFYNQWEPLVMEGSHFLWKAAISGINASSLLLVWPLSDALRQRTHDTLYWHGYWSCVSGIVVSRWLKKKGINWFPKKRKSHNSYRTVAPSHVRVYELIRTESFTKEFLWKGSWRISLKGVWSISYRLSISVPCKFRELNGLR